MTRIGWPLSSFLHYTTFLDPILLQKHESVQNHQMIDQLARAKLHLSPCNCDLCTFKYITTPRLPTTHTLVSISLFPLYLISCCLTIIASNTILVRRVIHLHSPAPMLASHQQRGQRWNAIRVDVPPDTMINIPAEFVIERWLAC